MPRTDHGSVLYRRLTYFGPEYTQLQWSGGKHVPSEVYSGNASELRAALKGLRRITDTCTPPKRNTRHSWKSDSESQGRHSLGACARRSGSYLVGGGLSVLLFIGRAPSCSSPWREDRARNACLQCRHMAVDPCGAHAHVLQIINDEFGSPPLNVS